MREILTGILNPQFIKFLFVGGSATLIQLFLLFALVECFLVHAVMSSCVAYLLSSIYNYILNYTLTFSSTKQHSETFPKFVLVVAIGVSVNTFIFWLTLNLINHYLIAQGVAIFFTLICNYLLHKYWIYQKDNNE